MLENHEHGESLGCVTKAEILSAIRYLDPELEPRGAGQDAGTACAIFVMLLAALTAVAMYLCVCFWRA